MQGFIYSSSGNEFGAYRGPIDFGGIDLVRRLVRSTSRLGELRIQPARGIASITGTEQALSSMEQQHASMLTERALFRIVGSAEPPGWLASSVCRNPAKPSLLSIRFFGPQNTNLAVYWAANLNFAIRRRWCSFTYCIAET